MKQDRKQIYSISKTGIDFFIFPISFYFHRETVLRSAANHPAGDSSKRNPLNPLHPRLKDNTTMAYRRPFQCRFPQACALVATGLSTFARGSLTLWRRQYAMSFVLSAIFLMYVQACPASSVRRPSSSASLKASAPFPQTGRCPCFPLPARIHKAGWRGRLRALKD